MDWWDFYNCDNFSVEFYFRITFELLSHSKSFYIILYMKNWILKFVTFSTDFYFFIIILLNVNIMHTLYISCNLTC